MSIFPKNIHSIDWADLIAESLISTFIMEHFIQMLAQPLSHLCHPSVMSCFSSDAYRYLQNQTFVPDDKQVRHSLVTWH